MLDFQATDAVGMQVQSRQKFTVVQACDRRNAVQVAATRRNGV